ncbi:uncharacterized protein TNCV_274391 [Trichonephila clavipes]|nr:uncharacterized protein TNCV_274391 [Trichonephila clavipes]
MLDVTKYPPSAHGFTCRNCGGGDRGRVAIYRPFGEVSLSLNRTVTCMVLKVNDRRTSCPCHDEFRGPRSDYVGQVNEGYNIHGKRVRSCVTLSPTALWVASFVRDGLWVALFVRDGLRESERPKNTNDSDNHAILRAVAFSPTTSQESVRYLVPLFRDSVVSREIFLRQMAEYGTIN